MSNALRLPNRFNVADHFILPNLAPGRIDRPYLHCGDEVLTCGGLHAQVNRCGNVLRALGVEPEQRVVLLMGESLTLPVCFWAAVRIGAVAVPVNPALPAADLAHVLADSRARVLLVDAELWPTVAELCAQVRTLRHALIVNGRVAGQRSLADLMAGAATALDSEPMSPHLPAFWLYTSGSTGPPKAAVHLHQDMVAVVRHYTGPVLGLGPEDLGFSVPKMFFAYGLGNSLYFPLAVQGQAVIQPGPPEPERIFATLERFRPTVFYAVPSQFGALLDLYEAWQADPARAGRLPRLEHLRFAVSGGEWLPPTLLERWRRHFGCDILDGIGSTEALHFYLVNRPGQVVPGSTGRAFAGYDLRLVDEAGRDVPDGEVGVLLLRGQSTAPAYWNNRDRTAATMRGEWLFTGDRFHRDGDGNYWYHGRDDDMMKVRGSWVSPAEVEGALLTHPAVAECAVVGRRDERGLTRPRAVVVLRPGFAEGPALAGELCEAASRALADFKVPRWVEFAPDLPRTPTGKVQRFRLRD